MALIIILSILCVSRQLCLDYFPIPNFWWCWYDTEQRSKRLRQLIGRNAKDRVRCPLALHRYRVHRHLLKRWAKCWRFGTPFALELLKGSPHCIRQIYLAVCAWMLDWVERTCRELLFGYVDTLDALVLVWDIDNQDVTTAETIRNRSYPRRIECEAGYHEYDDSGHEQKALTGKLASKGTMHDPPFRSPVGFVIPALSLHYRCRCIIADSCYLVDESGMSVVNKLVAEAYICRESAQIGGGPT